MKRQIQKTGVRKWAGDDLISLQNEPLKALDAFFKQYGACIVQGLEITTNGENFDIAEGYVALPGKTAENNEDAFYIVPFEGVKNVVLPAFLTLACEIEQNVYADGKSKPTAYVYKAILNAAEPENDPYLKISEIESPRFVDVLQDNMHKFVTEEQITAWNNQRLNIDKLKQEFDNHKEDEAIHITEEERNAWTNQRLQIVEVDGEIPLPYPLGEHPPSVIVQKSPHKTGYIDSMISFGKKKFSNSTAASGFYIRLRSLTANPSSLTAPKISVGRTNYSSENEAELLTMKSNVLAWDGMILTESFNNTIKTGIYYVNSISDAPKKYGILRVTATSNFVLQEFFGADTTTSTTFVRLTRMRFSESAGWSAWT